MQSAASSQELRLCYLRRRIATADVNFVHFISSVSIESTTKGSYEGYMYVLDIRV